ncbi:hypothetical protein ACTFIW_003845 [Dictyostelium discoideum]
MLSSNIDVELFSYLVQKTKVLAFNAPKSIKDGLKRIENGQEVKIPSGTEQKTTETTNVNVTTKGNYDIRIKVGDILGTVLIDTDCSHSVITSNCNTVVASVIDTTKINCNKLVSYIVNYKSKYDNELQCSWNFHVVENSNHK